MIYSFCLAAEFLPCPSAGAIMLGVCALVLGCADPSQARMHTVAVASPPPRVDPIDGSYNGIALLVSGAAMSCGPDTANLQVKNGAFRYVLNQPQVPWEPRRSFDVVIAPHGSFQVQSGPASISGTVGQGHMQGQVVGDACSYKFEADNSGTL
jgi:hypothetical protein